MLQPTLKRLYQSSLATEVCKTSNTEEITVAIATCEPANSRACRHNFPRAPIPADPRHILRMVSGMGGKSTFNSSYMLKMVLASLYFHIENCAAAKLRKTK